MATSLINVGHGFKGSGLINEAYNTNLFIYMVFFMKSAIYHTITIFLSNDVYSFFFYQLQLYDTCVIVVWGKHKHILI